MDAGFEQPLTQAEREAGRLHRRRVGIEGAGAEGRRGAALGDLGGRSGRTASPSPSSRQAADASSQTPSWAGAVETCR